MALTDKLTAIGNAIREKTGKSDLLTLDQMPTEIQAIQTGGGDLPAEALTISGDCQYKFYGDNWNWYIEQFGNKIKTKDITDGQFMFQYSGVKNIPFEINFKEGQSASITSMFFGSTINQLPKINNLKLSGADEAFSACFYLRTIPDDIADTWDFSLFNDRFSEMEVRSLFQACYSLRKIPYKLISNYNVCVERNIYSYMFVQCYSLDEIVNLSVPYIASEKQSNCFYDTFNECARLKKLTFQTQSDGTAYSCNLAQQTIDLTSIGFVQESQKLFILDYNSGITADKEVTNSTTYATLQNDPDWFTCDYNYSRYNHDSAVETINSLPDTSAYTLVQRYPNTIKFKGASGTKTDGGAINTLTSSEIAVATAKGWTISLV